jgi:hypothetical protein
VTTEAQQAAQAALAQRLRTLLPTELGERFVDGTHTRRFADNLLPSFSSERVRLLSRQLTRGAGRELTPTASGKRRAHAPYSSAALAVNALGGWVGAEHELSVAGLGGFESSISLEHKLKIGHGGGEANLDCVLTTPAMLVGIESKLTETLAPHDPVEWKPPYHTPEMAGVLQGGWRQVFRASLNREWTPRHLGLEQLLKHALALNSHATGRTTHLIYLYWEPLSGDDLPEVRRHRSELAELAARVMDARPCFRASSYDQLFAEWMSIRPEASWRTEHVKQLRARYGDILL